MPSLMDIGQQIQEKRRGGGGGGAQFWSDCFLSPSVDPTVLVDLFWFVQNCRLLHMLKQGKVMT